MHAKIEEVIRPGATLHVETRGNGPLLVLVVGGNGGTEPNFPTTMCGIVVPRSGTRIRFFFAASMPFLIADGTSFALPMPKPTTPWPSPTTTSALKLRFLPPLTTLVTRLIDTTVSLISSCDGVDLLAIAVHQCHV